IIAVSEAVAGLFDGTPLRDRVRVVYNGVDTSAIISIGPILAPAMQLRSEGALVVGLFGVVSERKNQLLAAEAVARANAMGARVRLLLAGDAFKASESYGEALRARLARPDLADVAAWIPFQ